MNRAPVWILLCTAGLAAIGLAGEPSSKPALPATRPGVPAALLARLRAQYIPEEARTADISESDKVRRYQVILREGAWAERQYALASNLHEVRELMMAAAKGLATLEGTVEARELLTEVARRLATSSAPPENRVVADMLVMRLRIGELGGCPAEVADEVAAFVARYRDTPGEPNAMLSAAELCRVAEADAARSTHLRHLSEKHFSAPGVSEFLEAEGANPYLGRLMTARLTRLDGSALILPRDTLGKFTVIYFWSMARSGLGDRDAKGNFSFLPHYKSLRDVGVQFVGVNLDADRTRVARFVRDVGEGMDWPQTCSGLGLKDPTFQHYPIPTLPAYWLVGPDGRVISNNYVRGMQPWPQFSGTISNLMTQFDEMPLRMPYYRSGEFLLDLPEPAKAAASVAADVPAAQLNELRAKVTHPPALGLGKDKRAVAFREALELGQTLEEKYPKATNLPAVRTSMLVAALWLASETANEARGKQAQEIAWRIVESKVEGSARLLADYVRVSGELAGGAISRQEQARRIDGFVEKHAGGGLDWAACILGAVLAAECGDEDTRLAMVGELVGCVDRWPKARGFVRDFCNVNVDARTTLARPQPGSPIVATVPREIRGTLPLLGGGTQLVQDLKGKVVMIHFWSIACPAFTNPDTPARGMKPDEDIAVIGVNLDRSREEVEKYLKQHKEYEGWIHVFTGLGKDDPLARELDVYGLPRTALLDRDGEIYVWGRPGRMSNLDYRMPARRPKDRPSTSRDGTTTGIDGSMPRSAVKSGSTEAAMDKFPKEISLGLGDKVAMRLAYLPAGSCRIGSPPTEKGRLDDEIPRLRDFTKPFYMSLCHVTRGQFAAFVRQANYKTEAEREGWALVWNGAWRKADGASWRNCGFDQDDDHPVVCVSWNDAVEFCNWLGRTTGRTVGLPTEAQWEYACRAGTDMAYPWIPGREDGNGWCNAIDQSATRKFPGQPAFPWDDGYVYTSPAGKFKANAFGLYDMSGNAWQWCADWYEFSYPRESRDARGPSAGMYRVVRGGSWNSGPDCCRSAARRKEPPSASCNTVGFRVVVDTP